ncbi:MAG: hypothetical protein AAF899_12000, partial [Pseudomonadota bacterium]
MTTRQRGPVGAGKSNTNMPGVGAPGRGRTRGNLATRKGADRALRAAETLFGTLVGDLEREMKRLSPAADAGDGSCARELQALSKQTQKALQTVLDMELAVLKERRAIDEAAGGGGGLDLGAARD